MTEKRLVTIQDISCFGRCSITVALPLISAAGIETAIVPTAILSTHTAGFKGFTFHDLTDEVSKITEHWNALGLNFDAIYTGYLGSVPLAQKTAEFIKTFKKPETRVFVDPVMGDDGKLYPIFNDEYVAAVRSLCAGADLIAPNMTEASLLTGCEYRESGYGEEFVWDVLEKLAALGVKTALLTGVTCREGYLGVGCLDTTTGKRFISYNERVDISMHGTGDIWSSTFISALLRGKTLEEAVKLAGEFVVLCIRNTDTKIHWYGADFETGLPWLAEQLRK